MASATRNSRQLIAVVLGSQDRFEDTRRLLDYGFEGFYNVTIEAGSVLARVRVRLGEVPQVAVASSSTIGYTVPREEADTLVVKLFLAPEVKAPVEAGQVLGQVKIYHREREVAWAPLVALQGVKSLPWWVPFLGLTSGRGGI